MKSRSNRGASRQALRALIAIGMLVLSGCQAKQEAPANSAPAAGAAAVGSTQPITLTWNQQSNCVQYSQGTITIHVGDKIRFNSSVSQIVTLHVAAAAFGAGDTLITIPSQGSFTTGAAVTAGSYNANSTPPMCSPGGGVGPVIVVEETK